MNRYIVVVVLSLFFSGCSLKEVHKPISYFTLENATTQKQVQSFDAVLKVSQLRAPKYLNTPHIWYKKDSVAIDSYVYSNWNENFAALLEKNILDSLFASRVFSTVFNRYSKIRADMILEGEIENALQVVLADKAEVLFTIRLYLIDMKDSRLIDSHKFSYKQECESVDARGAVIAYNEIIKKFNKDTIQWLKTLVKEK